MAVLEITSANFETEVLKSDKPVLIDFWAEWCGPCRMLGPTVHELAEEREDIKVAQVNVDNETPLAISHGVNAIPTLILYENGKEVRRNTGVLSKAELNDFVG